MMPLLVRDSSDLPEGFNKPAGMVLMGAFLVRDFKSEAVPEVGPGQYKFSTCPVLTIGGELDGLCRITRIAESYHTQIDLSTDPVAAKHSLPVTIIPGMTHMQFSSGTPPKLVEQRDLLPEITYDEAYAAVASDVTSFAQGLLQSDWSALDQRLVATAAATLPIVQALQLEGYHQFKPPCYCEAVDEYGGLEYGTCEEMPGCQADAPWTVTAQQIMTGTTEGVQVVGRNSQHIVTEEDPSCHLPHVHDGTDRTTGTVTRATTPSENPGHNDTAPLCTDSSSCTLNVTTVTQLVYATGSEFDIWRLNIGNDNIDTGYFPISATEMKAKMKSRQATYQAANDDIAGHDDSTLAALDGADAGRCAEINQAALDIALGMVAASTKTRYLQHGQQMVIDPEDQSVCAAGPCWIWARLDYSGRWNTDQVSVKSPSFEYKNSNAFPCGEDGVEGKLLPCPAGMHYCKLLSPARAVEWMYVDSLRRSYSLHSQGKALEAQTEEPARAALFPSMQKKYSDDERCCTDCSGGTEKYYSIAKLFNNCGESCILPEDFKKYKLFEPGLTLADTNTPCFDRNYTQYLETTTHGEQGPVQATLDMYGPADAKDAKAV